MAVILVDGFDIYNGIGGSSTTSVGLGSRWVAQTNNISLVTGRFGGQAVRCELGLTNIKRIYLTLPTTYTSATLGAAVYLTNTLTNAPFLMGLCSGTAGDSAAQAYVRANVDGSVSVVTGTGTVLGTSAINLITPTVWCYIEFSLFVNDVTGTAAVSINGTNVLSLTNVDTRSQAAATFDTIQLGPLTGTYTTFSGQGVYFDDVYLTDTTSPLGEQRVITSYPTSDVLTTYWSSSTGGAAPYTMIDEATCDGDTTYAYSSTTGSRIVTGVSSLPVPPVSVNAVQITGFARKDETQFRQLALEYQNLAGAVATGPTYTLGGSYIYTNALYPQNPLTGMGWTATDVNNMRIGARVIA